MINFKKRFRQFKQLSLGEKIYFLTAVATILFFSLMAVSSIFLQKYLRQEQDLRKQAQVDQSAWIELEPSTDTELAVNQTHQFTIYLDNLSAEITDIRLTFYVNTNESGVIGDLKLIQPGDTYLELSNDSLVQLNPTTYKARFLGFKDESQFASGTTRVPLVKLQARINKPGAIKFQFDPNSYLYTEDNRNQLAFKSSYIYASYDPGSANTAAPSPTQTAAKGETAPSPAKKQCNQTCQANLDCQAGLICYQNRCRLANNPDDTNCLPVKEPEPTAATEAAQAATAAQTNVEPSPTTKPVPVSSDDTALDAVLQLLQDYNISLPMLIAGGIGLLMILIISISLLSKSTRKSRKTPDFSSLETTPSPLKTKMEKRGGKKLTKQKADKTKPPKPPAPKPTSSPDKPEASESSEAPPSSMLNRIKEKGVSPPKPDSKPDKQNNS